MSKGGLSKGGPFEREICEKLSLWWSNNEDADIFWRTEGSGGRATCRKGKPLWNSYGDVTFRKPEGEALIRFCLIEIKRGYSEQNILDFVDAPSKKGNEVKEWLLKNEIQRVEANRKSSLIIWRKDRKNAIAIIDQILLDEMSNDPETYIQLMFKDRVYYIMSLEDFFDLLDPDVLK